MHANTICLQEPETETEVHCQENGVMAVAAMADTDEDQEGDIMGSTVHLHQVQQMVQGKRYEKARHSVEKPHSSCIQVMTGTDRQCAPKAAQKQAGGPSHGQSLEETIPTCYAGDYKLITSPLAAKEMQHSEAVVLSTKRGAAETRCGAWAGCSGVVLCCFGGYCLHANIYCIGNNGHCEAVTGEGAYECTWTPLAVVGPLFAGR
jgi:hypothetical protein